MIGKQDRWSQITFEWQRPQRDDPDSFAKSS